MGEGERERKMKKKMDQADVRSKGLSGRGGGEAVRNPNECTARVARLCSCIGRCLHLDHALTR